MNVAQLIAKLQELPQGKEVVIPNWSEQCFEMVQGVEFNPDNYNYVILKVE